MDRIPQCISKVVSFQYAFLLYKQKRITINGPNPAQNTGNADKPAPALNWKKAPIMGATAQIVQDTKFGFACPLAILII